MPAWQSRRPGPRTLGRHDGHGAIGHLGNGRRALPDRVVLSAPSVTTGSGFSEGVEREDGRRP